MPTTRSGGHYGPDASGTPSTKGASAAKQAALSSKRKLKAAGKTYAKAKPQPFKKELATKVKRVKDVGKLKKKEIQYKKPPIKASVKKTKEISKIQATKRKEAVDKKRFRGPARIQPDGGDFPDIGTTKPVVEDKPGYIFMRQQVDPDSDNEPVDLYKIEIEGRYENIPRETPCGVFELIFMPNTCCRVASMSQAKQAACNALSEYTKRWREGWFEVSGEQLDTFIDLYNNAVNYYKV